MALTKEAKRKIVETFQTHKLDTGSPEVQIALLTARIQELTEHFKTHRKDLHSMRGLQKTVNLRKRLLKYLKDYSPERYQKLIERLDIRGV